MATSGSFNFIQHRNSIIHDSLVTAGIVRAEETPSGEMNASAARMLNRMLKAWTAHGLQLWLHKDVIIPLVDGKRTYDLYETGDRYFIKKDAVETQLNGALAASATAVTVDSTTGMTAADNIGIITTGDTIHWDTIASVDTSTTLTLTTGVAAAADDNAYVVAYTTNAPRCHRITDAELYRDSNRVYPMNIIPREEYYHLSKGTNEGTPIHLYFVPAYDRAAIYVWPMPESDDMRIIANVQTQVDDLDEATDDLYYPQYWMDAIHWNLAWRLYLDYGRARGTDRYGTEPNHMKAMARETLKEAMDFDTEYTEVQLEPEVKWQPYI